MSLFPCVTDSGEFVVILVGEWNALPDSANFVGNGTIQRCQSEPAEVKSKILTARASWLLLGQGVADTVFCRLVSTARRIGPEVRVAVLGDPDDLDRCERWFRRGANVYLSKNTSPDRAIAVLDIASRHHVLAIDQCFQGLTLARLAQMGLAQIVEGSALTRREQEVLHLIRTGLRNSEIAAALNLKEGTVEFHVSNVLSKLGAGNRTEAADRASLIGV